MAVFAALLPLACLAGPSAARSANGFDLSGATVAQDEIVHGGVSRDEIPALEQPRHAAAQEAPWRGDDYVVGVALGGEARAYPLAVLVWHELVNDELGGRPILVSYCPLCGSALVFDRRPPPRDGTPAVALTFGVSGLLYRSDLLMYDRETESLWSQIAAHAVTGPMAGRRLELVRARVEPWSAWRARHPDTRVLSTATGHRRPYGATPYRAYERSEQLYFPVEPIEPVEPVVPDRSYHPKMPTVGLRLPGGAARAYPLAEVTRNGGRVSETFAGHEVVVSWSADTRAFHVEAPGEVEVIESYWFAWMAFHRQTSVFRAEPSPETASPRGP